jgi:hypothetical protein
MDPRHELTVALTAPGIAASGIPSTFASTTARAEFCIPVSIETVLHVFRGYPKERGVRYPRAKPKAWRERTALRSVRPQRDITPAF